MIGESSLTLYRYNGKGFDRYYIPECHWQENKARNVLKTGDQNADSVTVYIPLDSLMLTANENTQPSLHLLPNPQTASKDIIVKGECNFTFDNFSQQTVSESLKQLRSEHQIYTVMSIDRKLYGSRNLQHIKISAR